MEKARGAKAGLLLEQSQLAPGLKEGGAGPAGRGVAVAGAALGQARFRAAAFSVLSPANRQFMEAQEAAAAEGPKEDRKIILGGETFKVGLFYLTCMPTSDFVTCGEATQVNGW